jgi:hypothetical protein
MSGEWHAACFVPVMDLRSVSLLAVASLATLLTGCAAEPLDDAGTSEGAATAEEVASTYEFSTKLFEGVRPSAGVATLGVRSWTAFEVVNKQFFGLALYALDESGNVKYVVLQNARRRADGKTTIAVAELDKSGKKARVPPQDASIQLVSEIRYLRPALQRSAEHAEDPRVRSCAEAVVIALTGAVVTGALVLTTVAYAGAVATLAESTTLVDTVFLGAMEGVSGTAGIATLGAAAVTVLECATK